MAFSFIPPFGQFQSIVISAGSSSGIRFNDPAAGNEARFELLTSDLLSRIELVRGPQSALWGSEALGGVIAVETANPFRRHEAELIERFR